MHAIHRSRFITKIGEHFFSHINQFISRVQNFSSLNLKEKSVRYTFFAKSKQQNSISQVKNVSRLRWVGGFMSGIKG